MWDFEEKGIIDRGHRITKTQKSKRMWYVDEIPVQCFELWVHRGSWREIKLTKENRVDYVNPSMLHG